MVGQEIYRFIAFKRGFMRIKGKAMSLEQYETTLVSYEPREGRRRVWSGNRRGKSIMEYGVRKIWGFKRSVAYQERCMERGRARRTTHLLETLWKGLLLLI